MRFVRFIIFVVLIQLSPLCRAQFVYFNEYLPEAVDLSATRLDNVIVKDSVFYGFVQRSDLQSDSNRFVSINQNGQVVLNQCFPFHDVRVYYLGDVFCQYDSNKYISVGERPVQVGKAWGAIDVYDSLFNVIRSVEVGHYGTDTFVYSLQYVKELDSGALLSCGFLGIDIDSGLTSGLPWADITAEIIELRNTELEIIWSKVYMQNADEEMRNSDLLVLDDSSFITGGYRGPGPNLDNFILKLSPEGDSLDYVALGGPCSEYGVKFAIMPNGNILAAYESCQSTWQWSDAHYSDFHLSVLDPNTLDIIEDHTYPQPETSGLLINVYPTELLPTPDGGYAYMFNMGYGVIIQQPAILKVDADLQQQWFHTYTLSAQGDSQNSYMKDIDLTPDSGFIAVGVSIVPGLSQFRSWALKIDACGDEQNLGCWPLDTTTIASSDISTLSYSLWPNPTSAVLHVQGESVLSSATVYDLTGRMIMQKEKINASSLAFDTSAWPANIYMLRLTDVNGRTRSQRWVKE